MPEAVARSDLDALDRRLIVATQAGLPRVSRPYDAIGEALGIAGEDVIARLRRMLDAGVIRRIGAVPNHYAIGYTANGMSVWDCPRRRNRRFAGRCLPWPRHPLQHGDPQEDRHAHRRLRPCGRAGRRACDVSAALAPWRTSHTRRRGR